MSNIVRIALGLFVIAHGIVHPILAIVPDNQLEGAPVGTFWNKSWLLGETSLVKNIIYLLSALAALLFLLAGLSVMEALVPGGWWRFLWISGASASAILLVVFWHPWFVLGLVIDIVMLAIVLFSEFSPV